MGAATATQGKAEIYYKGESTPIKKETTRYGGWGQLYTSLNFDLDSNKELDHIKIIINGFNGNGPSYGRVDKIIFTNVSN